MFGKIFLGVAACFISVSLFSQKIKLLNEKDQNPVSDCYVKAFSSKGKKLKEYITNKDGEIFLHEFQESDLPISLMISGYHFKSFPDTLFSFKEKLISIKLYNDFTTFNELVVTAQYKKQSADDAVHKIKVINEEKIKSMGAQNLRDVFTNELNIRISQDFALGSSMSLQGVSGQNVKILIDGVPLTGRLNGNIDISQINMNNVERIEIIEGPLSVSYGTDALAGTINIITKKNIQDNFSLSSYNFYESIGNFNNNIKLGWANINNHISLSMSRNYFDGWSNGDNPFYYNFDPIADHTRFQEWKPKEQLFGTLIYRRLFGELTLDLTSDYFWEEVINKGAPRQPYFQTAFDDYYKTYRFNNSASLNGKVGSDKNIHIILAYNHFRRIKNTYFRDLTTIEDQLATSSGAQDTSTFNNFMSRGTFSNVKEEALINYELGYDINQEVGFGPRILEGQQSIGDYAAFSTAEINAINRLVLRPGIRLIYNTAYRAPIVPSLNLRYNILENKDKNQRLSLRASYARGFRAPDLKELYFFFVDINHNIQGNPDLVAEHSNNFNVSSTFTKRKKNLSTKLMFSGFYNQIDNMIGLAQGNGTSFSYFNIDRFETAGGQLTSDWNFKNWSLSAGVSYIGRYNRFNELENVTIKTPFIFSPEGQLNIGYYFTKVDLTVSSFYKFTGKMPIVNLNNDGSPTTTIIDDFNTLDFTITKVFFKKKLQLTVGAKNLFNVTNINGIMPGGVHSGGGSSIAVAMGRTYFMAVNLQLTKKKKK